MSRLNYRASVNAVVNRVMSNANGIGESKTEAKANSDIKGLNGQDISIKNHSVSSAKALRSVANQMLNHIKENNPGRVLSNVNPETVKDFINSKIAEGIKENTLNQLITTISKVSDNLNSLGINTVSRAEIGAYRNDLKEAGHTLKGDTIVRCNQDPQAITRAMNESTPYGLSSDLSLQAGMRAGDSTDSSKWTLNNDNTIKIEGSKGGKSYTTTAVSQATADRVAQAIENGYKVSYSEYRENLKEVVLSTGQEWQGTHSLRFDHINEKHTQNLANNMTESESKAELSIQNGHGREEIIDIYLIK